MNDLPGFLDFTRPGHGDIDDNNYPPFIRFWRRYGRNFMKLLQLNLVYAVVTLPVYVWLISLVNVTSVEAGGNVLSILGAVLLSFVIDAPMVPLMVLVGISILLMGPTTAALSYSALNCAWDRPGLFWPGFWEAWKENWKQSLPIGIVDALVCFVSLYYLVDGGAAFGSLGIVMQVLWILLSLAYAMMRVYVYPIMVTVELPMGALLKNSIILALLKPWRPLLVIAITAVMALLCLVIDIVLVPCFLYSLTAFTAAFLTRPLIEKYLLCGEGSAEA